MNGSTDKTRRRVRIACQGAVCLCGLAGAFVCGMSGARMLRRLAGPSEYPQRLQLLSDRRERHIKPTRSAEQVHGAAGPLLMKCGFSDPVLQRLVDAGATIERRVLNRPWYNGDSEGDSYHNPESFVAARVIFEGTVIDENIARDLACLFDADAAEGPAASLAEIGEGEVPLALYLGRCEVGRRELAALSGAKRLMDLTFMETPINDETLAAVETMPALSELWVAGCDVGDEGLAFLGRCAKLKKIFAEGTRVGDATLARIRGAEGLEQLALSRTRITNEGLRSMEYFPDLWRLNLSGCHVSDAGMRHLCGLGLTDLDLSDTDTSDACLPYLLGIPLRNLHAVGTHITRDGVKRMLPDVHLRPDSHFL